MSEFRVGRVIRTDAKVCHVDFDGEVKICAPRGKLFENLGDVKGPIAVGDWVDVSLGDELPGIEAVKPRTNYLPRIASSHDPRAQILFSNVDQLLVMGSAAKPRLSTNRTDRLLAACAYYEIPAHLILNKIDLDKHGDVDEFLETYKNAGIEIFPISATEQEGIDAVAEQLRDKVSVLYGASGTGKSTLINAIQPGLDIKTAKISKYWDAGKHTTSYSQMHRVDAINASIIDTPGIRVFRLYGINKAELRDLFKEFEPFQGNCRFPDCSHDHEPECAVFDAVEEDKISMTRFESYLQILDELVPPPEDDTPVAPPGE
ncbi:MAG: ribosome biogenesis GTPase [Planctomycetota bacterium]